MMDRQSSHHLDLARLIAQFGLRPLAQERSGEAAPIIKRWLELADVLLAADSEREWSEAA